MSRRGAEIAEFDFGSILLHSEIMSRIDKITEDIIGACIKIHKELGPGLLESVYEEVLFYELTKKYGYQVTRQQQIKIAYDGIEMEKAFRADIIVENLVLVELKSVEEMHRKFKKITLSYIRLANLEVGLLINFGEELLTKGITRLVNDYKGNY